MSLPDRIQGAGEPGQDVFSAKGIVIAKQVDRAIVAVDGSIQARARVVPSTIPTSHA
jgi:hypothetical protein